MFFGLACREGDDPNHPRMISSMIEPLKPLTRSLYFCGSRFQTELLREHLSDSVRYGFCIVDGSGADFYVVSGNQRDLVFTLTDPNLPKKHNKGGQSAPRFGRIRDEKRDQYVKKLADRVNSTFIDSATHKVTVESLIFAGQGEIKSQLAKCQELDKRIATRVVRCVDIQYDGEAGLAEAVDKSSDLLAELEYNTERKAISQFFREVGDDSGSACYGVSDVFYALEAGAVKSLILWQDIPLHRFVVTLPDESTPLVVYASAPDEISSQLSRRRNKSSAASSSSSSSSSVSPSEKYEIVEDQPLLDWIVENVQAKFGVDQIKLVSGASAEGHQFAEGFGGLAAMLRYRLDQLPSMTEHTSYDLGGGEDGGSDAEEEFDFDY